MDELVRIGDGHGFGLLSRANAPVRDQAIVLFNAGLIHRIGPFRWHVELARDLARLGFNVLRFDLPRVGDGRADPVASRSDAVQAALNATQRATGCRGFVIGGLCSGADLGWKVALTEPRVVGLLLLDGVANRDVWFRVGQLALAAARPISTWPGLLLRQLRQRQAGAASARDYRDWPASADVRPQIAQMLERGVRVLAIYTSGAASYLLHRRQFASTFGPWAAHRGLQVEYWPDCDHMFLSLTHRDRMFDTVRRWCTALPRVRLDAVA